jgi:hypothetical protein
MAHLSLSSWFKGKGQAGKKAGVEMIECPRCRRFFPQHGHAHEPLCRDCWKLERAAGPSGH